MEDQDQITYFGETDYRNKRTKFGIKAKDRGRHMYVIGKTGMGKSTLLENLAIQDIQNGLGMGFIDPHGGTAEKLLDYVPEHRIKDVIYFAPFDIEYPISFNVLENVDPDKRHLVVSGLMSTFKKIWVDAWSARMEYILTNTLLALLEFPDATLLGVNRMLSDKEYRKKVLEHVTDPSVRSFWLDEFAKYTERMAAEAVPAIQNKVGQFTSNPLIRNMVGQPKSTINFRKVMDEKKILIMNLSKGRVGEQNASLLGGMLITKLYLAAMSRADASADALKVLPHFYFYVDEFQSFASDSFADILSEARKYKLCLTIAHQYVEQMSEMVRAAVFGNAGTMLVFRVGAIDADVFEKEFAPQFTAEDIVNLGAYQMYLKLMIDGVGSKPFSARALPPIEAPQKQFKKEIIDNSRIANARPRAETEKDIQDWHAPIVVERKERSDRPQDARPSGPSSFTNQSSSQNQSRQFQPRPSIASTSPASVPPVKVFTPTPQPIAPAPVKSQNPNPKVSNPVSQPVHMAYAKPQEPISKSPIQQTTIQQKSPALKAILAQLEEKEAPKTNQPFGPRQNNFPQTPKKQDEVSLAVLKPKSDVQPTKDVRPETRSLLKDALAKATASRESDTPVTQKSAPQPFIGTVINNTPIQKSPVRNPQVPVAKPVFIRDNDTHNSNSRDEHHGNVPAIPQKPKEVPEDILRKILE